MNTEATLAAEPTVTETPEAEVKATEPAAIETPEPAQETESDKAAKAQAKIDRRFANMTKKLYEAKAELEAERRFRQTQTQSESEPDEGDDLIQRVRQEVERDFENRQKQATVSSVFKKANLDINEFRESFPELTTPQTAMAIEAILESDVAPKILKYINENPDEAERIASLSPSAQAKEIGKLEVKLSSPAPVKKSGAPAPITPVSGGSVKTDPDPKNAEEWIEWRNKQTRRG